MQQGEDLIDSGLLQSTPPERPSFTGTELALARELLWLRHAFLPMQTEEVMDLFSAAQIIRQNWVGRKKTYLACDVFIDGKLNAEITNTDVNLISLKHWQICLSSGQEEILALNASIHVF